MNPKIETPVVESQPQIAAAIAPPPHEPASPIATVNQIGMGSGPGTASRARPPVMKPASMIATIAPNTPRSLRRMTIRAMRDTCGTIRRILPIVSGAAVLLLGVTAASARAEFEVVGNDAPAWSPDGTEIAFTSFRNGKGDIYVMRPNGKNQQRLTTSDAHDDLAAWSPNSKQIAFSSDRTGQLEIWLMNRDGTDQRQLTFDEHRDYGPTWSPDAKRIAFR
jgi:hypothetical protein